MGVLLLRMITGRPGRRAGRRESGSAVGWYSEERCKRAPTPSAEAGMLRDYAE